MARIGNDLIEIIAVVGFVALIGSGIILGIDVMHDAAPYDTTDVQDERHNLTGALPQELTVNTAPEGVEELSETIVHQDSPSGTNSTLTRDTNYSADYAAGTFNITDVSGYNDPGSVFWIDYTYQEESDSRSFLADSITAFDIVPSLLEVLVVFGFLAILIGLLWFAMGRMGLGRQARGGL